MSTAIPPPRSSGMRSVLPSTARPCSGGNCCPAERVSITALLGERWPAPAELDRDDQPVVRGAGPDPVAQGSDPPDGGGDVLVKPAPEMGDDDARREAAKELDQVR